MSGLTKNEYIAKYGEERYRQHLKEVYDHKKRLTGKNHKGPINQIFFDVTYVPDLTKETMDRREDEEKLAYRAQNELKRWWRRDNSKRNIIIVTAGNVNKTKGESTFTVELYQLNLSEEEISRFKVGAAEIIGKIFKDSDEN